MAVPLEVISSSLNKRDRHRDGARSQIAQIFTILVSIVKVHQTPNTVTVFLSSLKIRCSAS